MFRAIQITASNHFVHFFSPCFICAPFFFSFNLITIYAKESHRKFWKNILKVCRNIFLFISLFFYVSFFLLCQSAIRMCNKIAEKYCTENRKKVHIRFSADVRVGKTVFYDTFIRYAQIFLYNFSTLLNKQFIKASIYK